MPHTAASGLLFDDDRVAHLGDPGYFLVDNYLGPGPARELREATLALCRSGALHPAGLSRGESFRIERASRGDEIAWLDPESASPPLRHWLDRLEVLRDEINRSAWLGLRRYEVMAARYPGRGEGYVRHLDAFPGGPSRELSVLYYLNEDWEPAHGGALRLFLPEGREVDVAPRLDRLVVFRSAVLEHQVCPTWRERLSLTAWFYGREELPR